MLGQKAGTRWLVVQSSPDVKASFLKSLLMTRFPRVQFDYERGGADSVPKIQGLMKQSLDGAILELKQITLEDLKWLDRIKNLLKRPVVLVLTGDVYHLLRSRRPQWLETSLPILTEPKSLDYLLQIPRCVEEINRRRLLRVQNERLSRLVQQAKTEGSLELEDFASLSPRGLKVTFRNVKRVQNSLGEIAFLEILEAISRAIRSQVRNSDRVLRSSDHEFFVFLSHAEQKQIQACRNRLRSTLRHFEMRANERMVQLPFAISSVDQYPTAH